MECREFEELIQEMLDCRQFRMLPEDAAVHVGSCTHCRSNYSFYQQLSVLTASPSNQDHGFDGVPATRGLATRLAEPVVAPVLRLQVKRQPFGMLRRNGLAMAALLCLSLVTWRYWPLGVFNDTNSAPLAVVSEPAPDISRIASDPATSLSIELASNEVAGSELKTPTYRTSEDLQKLTEGWDESVVALDRQWQQMAAGRVRAHQIPGLQPAVYPITGAVEAFRKTMIVRNQHGVAAGVRW